MAKINRKKYGIISDIHTNPRKITPILHKLKNEGVDALVLNGDIGNNLISIYNTLDQATSLGVETYVQPGSHEKLEDYFTVLEIFLNKNSNLINVIQDPKIEFDDHHLVFLPGSDYRSGGEFALDDFDISNNEIYGDSEGKIHITNMRNLDSMVTDSEKTIVFCHVPRKFYDIDTCVDYAYFGELKDGSVYPGIAVEAIVKNKFRKNLSLDYIEDIVPTLAKKMGISLKQENRGNACLEKAYSRNGITKAISGHFHEASHRANDSGGKHITENYLTDNLFYNSGTADDGLAGIVMVEENKISYKNIIL